MAVKIRMALVCACACVVLLAVGCAEVAPSGSAGGESTSGDALYIKVQGGEYRLPQGPDARTSVLVFFGYECPISNGFVPELVRLSEEFAGQGIEFCLVYAEHDLSLAAARQHAEDYGITFPAILDPQLSLARRFQATKMPEAVVLSPAGEVLYRGRIDDRYVDFGRKRAQPTTRDLRAALQAIADGQPVSVRPTPAIGCDIYFPEDASGHTQ